MRQWNATTTSKASLVPRPPPQLLSLTVWKAIFFLHGANKSYGVEPGNEAKENCHYKNFGNYNHIMYADYRVSLYCSACSWMSETACLFLLSEVCGQKYTLQLSHCLFLMWLGLHREGRGGEGRGGEGRGGEGRGGEGRGGGTGVVRMEFGTLALADNQHLCSHTCMVTVPVPID